MTVCQKLGMILGNKVVQKLKLENNVFNKKWSSKLIFLNDFFFFNSGNFGRKKLPFKVQFEDFFIYFSFKHVDSWAKILLFRTHHL